MMLMAESGGKINVGEMVLHHTADAWTIDLYPIGAIHLPRWADVHVGTLTLNLSPTKHVVYLAIASFLAHTFLAYFVGVEALFHWITRPPAEHPAAFLVEWPDRPFGTFRHSIDFFGDGSVVLIDTRGHTQGSQSIRRCSRCDFAADVIDAEHVARQKPASCGREEKAA